MPQIKNLTTFIQLTTQLLEANPTTVSPPSPSPNYSPTSPPSLLTPFTQTRITTRYSLAEPETGSKNSRKRKRAGAPDETSPDAPTRAATAEHGVKHARLVVTTSNSTTGASLRFRSSERTEISRLLRSMVAFGAVMAGRGDEVKEEEAPASAEADAEAGGAVKEEKEKEKEEESGKGKKRRKKGKR
jgi:hypothetical protein